MGSDMAKNRPDLDRELADLPPELRWREWMRRVEAVLFASASPVSREALGRVVGQAASVDLLVEDLSAELTERPYEIACVADAWMLRTRTAYAPVIRAAATVSSMSRCSRPSPITSRSPVTGSRIYLAKRSVVI
jgi:segregation and condensation protein B